MTPSLPKKKLMGVVAILAFGLTALFAILDFGVLVPVTFVLGYFILLPLIGILGEQFPLVESDPDETVSRDEVTPSVDDGQQDPVDRLRERYANGELSDEAFERRLERLLETEDVRARRRTGSGRTTQDERELEIE